MLSWPSSTNAQTEAQRGRMAGAGSRSCWVAWCCFSTPDPGYCGLCWPVLPRSGSFHPIPRGENALLLCSAGGLTQRGGGLTGLQS